MTRSVTPGHTAGPWETRMARSPDNTGGYDWAIAKDGKVIAEVFEHVDYGTDGARYDKQPVVANARLIAAAPMLLEGASDTLEALKLLRVGLASDPAVVEVLDAHISLLEHAILKATGGAS